MRRPPEKHATACRKCGGELPPRAGPGAPRENCLTCSPPRKKHGTTLDYRPEAIRAVALPEPRFEPVVPDFDRRGQALWDEMASKLPGPLHRTVLVEACRMADRLDRMNGLLSGERESWALLRLSPDDYNEITVVITSIVTEARQYALVLKSLAAELRTAMREAAKANPAETGEQGDTVDDLLGEMDELSLRRNRHGA